VTKHIPGGAPVIVAGDFNDWNEKLDDILEGAGLSRARLKDVDRVPTFPSIVPVLALDRVYTRGLDCQNIMVPRGGTWPRLSDHLPLVVELDLAH
jgi:endonuclease/exonuclease/phosphatase family metal-dependent hydrolase